MARFNVHKTDDTYAADAPDGFHGEA